VKESFENAIRFVLFWEKHLSDDPDDIGGLTIWGISYRSHPEHVQAMRDMSEEDSREYAKGIYKKLYWDAIGCDSIVTPLDIVIFDCAVNQGVIIAKAIAALTIARDPQKWEDALLLRVDRYDETRGAYLYLKGWAKRIVSLRDYVVSDFKNLHWD